MKSALLICLLLSFSTLILWAQSPDCQTVDLRADFGPPRSQGNVGWCYANTAADLISHHYRKELKEPVSAVDIALNFNYYWTAENFREGGFIFLALDLAMKTGSCPASLDQVLFGKGTKHTLKDKINFILDLKHRLDKGQDEYVKKAIEASQRAGSILKEERAFDIMTVMALSTPGNVLGKLAQMICKGNRHQFSHRARIGWSSIYTGSTRSRLLNRLNEQLNQKNPVGVAYYAGFFDSATAPKSGEDRHMSLIVGRKWDVKSNSCEYLIRNSWGTRCTGYKNLKLKGKCEAGNIWVDEMTLRKYIYGITFLE
ncbi:MAG: hypothetical protein ACK5V3_03090 [Bdellovibrionales bacterium]